MGLGRRTARNAHGIHLPDRDSELYPQRTYPMDTARGMDLFVSANPPRYASSESIRCSICSEISATSCTPFFYLSILQLIFRPSYFHCCRWQEMPREWFYQRRHDYPLGLGFRINMKYQAWRVYPENMG